MTKKQIPFAKPWLGEEEAQAAAKAVLSGWVTQGPQVLKFEKAIAEYTGAVHACAVANCTVALHLSLLAAGVKPGDVVLTVSHSFIATANAIRHCGAEPVFVDVEPGTYNMDPVKLASALQNDFTKTPDGLYYRHVSRVAKGESPLCYIVEPKGRLAAVLAVHQVGMPADLPRILSLCHKEEVPLVEDAAPALGSRISLDGGSNWEPVGKPHGLVASFSFHPRKPITTGEGGMVTTANSEMDQRFRLLRHHGMALPDYLRHSSGKIEMEAYLTTGFNYRMSDILAAVGLAQMDRLEESVRRRRELAGVYREELGAVSGLELPIEPAYARSNWQSYVLVLDDTDRRQKAMQYLLEEGVHTRRSTMSAHMEKPYQLAWPMGSLPESERISTAGLTLPMFPTMSREQAFFVARTLKRALGC